MKTYIDNLPKAELHLHIEGTLEPELLFEIANRNHIKIPFESVEAVKAAYQFNCLQDFLDIYYQGAEVLLYERDFYELTYRYLEKCKDQNVKHVEIMFDPQTHTNRGISFQSVITGIRRAMEDAQKHLHVSSFLILSFLRHLSEEAAFETLQQALPFKSWIKAVGLDSSEKGNPPSKFKRVFKAAVQEGWIPLAHAGEEGDATYIWEAIDLLKVQRIDHGNNALQDPNLVAELVKRNVALTVCPLSNKALQVVKSLEEHPLKKMMDVGLKVTVNSDDPAYFGGGINRNFEEIQKALQLGKNELYTIARNSFDYSLLDDKSKQQHLTELETYHLNNMTL